MNVFLKFLRVRVTKAIIKEFVEPHGDEDTWFKATAKNYEANVKAQYALTQALNDDDLSCVINCKSAYKVWNDLIITHKETLQSRDLKLTCSVLNMRIFICLKMKVSMRCLLGSPRSLMVYLL